MTTFSGNRLLDRRGLTLVELLVAVVVAAIVMGAVFQVLVANQRTYTVQGERILGQQTVRGGVEILSADLREISPTLGDLIAGETNRVQIRVPRTFGVICEIIDSGPPIEAAVLIEGPVFTSSTDMTVFAEGDPERAADDEWLTGTISDTGTAACPGGQVPSQEMTLSNLVRPNGSPPASMGVVRVGAPVRSFEVVTYQVVLDAGLPFLGRQVGSGSVVPMVGPIATGNGLVFEFEDASGNAVAAPLTAATAAQVRLVRLTVRSESAARDPTGQNVSDELTTLIHLRN